MSAHRNADCYFATFQNQLCLQPRLCQASAGCPPNTILVTNPGSARCQRDFPCSRHFAMRKNDMSHCEKTIRCYICYQVTLVMIPCLLFVVSSPSLSQFTDRTSLGITEHNHICLLEFMKILLCRSNIQSQKTGSHDHQ
jgi:hypothetical protein